MKCVALLIAVIAYFGHVNADDRHDRQDVVQDPLGHLERDNSPPKGGSNSGSQVNSVTQANNFIDFVFLERMPNLIKDTPGLYPSAPLPPFTFTVEKTAITNRDLVVNVTMGGLKNFDTAVRRFGDCEPGEEAGNASITCRLSFDGIAADIFTMTKGDNLLATVKSVTVEAVVRNSTGLFDFTKAPNRPGFVRAFVVQHADFYITPGDNLDLNAIRMSEFTYYIARYLREELQSNLYGSYKRMLDFAFGPMTQ
uniref:Putative secreted salivary gland peptide n=1 Tax=Amblyomma americanum TaxID=6943 RepID=A0A0C9R6Q0_AMBAM